MLWRAYGPMSIAELCAELDGFSLHARVRIRAADRARLERVCRYVSRPPIASERLSLTPDGRVLYRLRKPFRDGTGHFVFDPLTFLERIAALVPRPRTHQLTYLSDDHPPDPLAPRAADDRPLPGPRETAARAGLRLLIRAVTPSRLHPLPEHRGSRSDAVYPRLGNDQGVSRLASLAPALGARDRHPRDHSPVLD